MKKIKVAVIGANGRMGQEIAKELRRNKKMIAYIGVTTGAPAKGYKFTEVDIEALKEAEPDLLIDFSSSELVGKLSAFCCSTGTPWLIGTTGLSEKDFLLIQKAAKNVPVFYSANMSIGVEALRQAIKSLAGLKTFRVHIEEVHHLQKKDKPSGTAKMLQAELVKTLGFAPRKPKSIRRGKVVGTHRIYAEGNGETVVFEHVAHKRAIFAKGAVLAAEWLISQKPGLYSMKDFVND